MLHAPEGVARQGLRHVQAVWLPEGVRRGEGVRHLWHADVRARAEDQGHVEKYMTKVDKYRKDEKLTALNYEAMQSGINARLCLAVRLRTVSVVFRALSLWTFY